MGRVIKYLALIVAVTTLSCCYDRFNDEPSDSSTLPVPNVTIGELAQMLQTEKLIIYDDMVVQGSVTTTDQNGNFYKSFIIQSDGYAMEVLEGIYDSYVRHDIDAVVSVKLQGLVLSSYNGVMQAGLEATTGSYYTLDYITLESLVDEHIFSNGTYSAVTPHEVEIGELSEDMCGRLVKISSLTHVPGEEDTQPYVWSGYEEDYKYQEFVDSEENVIYCYTSSYANFSLLPIPQVEVSLCGILQYGSISGVSGEQYMLTMRGVEDCE